MPYALNNIATTDAYSPANTLDCPETVRVNFTILNAAAYVSFGTTPGLVGGAQQGQEVLYPPGMYSMDRTIATVAVRSGAVGIPARVTIACWRKGELS